MSISCPYKQKLNIRCLKSCNICVLKVFLKFHLYYLSSFSFPSFPFLSSTNKFLIFLFLFSLLLSHLLLSFSFYLLLFFFKYLVSFKIPIFLIVLPLTQNNHKGDSPERDGSTPARPITQTEAEKLSSDELQFIRDAKNTNFSLLEEMFGSRGSHHEENVNVEAGIPQSGVENVSVYAHKASEASRLSEKCRAGREVKDLICDEYLKDSAVKEMPENCHHPQRENDVEEKLIHNQQQEQAFRDSAILPPTGSGNSSTQPSPSHRISTMSDPLPDTCHINPRISAVSDPMSEVCGGSECSEGGYEEPIRPSDPCANANPGANRRGWRTNNGGSVMESSTGGSVIDDTGITPEQETLEQQLKMMKLRLEEATKTIQAERE